MESASQGLPSAAYTWGSCKHRHRWTSPLSSLQCCRQRVTGAGIYSTLQAHQHTHRWLILWWTGSEFGQKSIMTTCFTNNWPLFTLFYILFFDLPALSCSTHFHRFVELCSFCTLPVVPALPTLVHIYQLLYLGWSSWNWAPSLTAYQAVWLGGLFPITVSLLSPQSKISSCVLTRSLNLVFVLITASLSHLFLHLKRSFIRQP